VALCVRAYVGGGGGKIGPGACGGISLSRLTRPNSYFFLKIFFLISNNVENKMQVQDVECNKCHKKGFRELCYLTDKKIMVCDLCFDGLPDKEQINEAQKVWFERMRPVFQGQINRAI
jgi:hypothetical protein